MQALMQARTWSLVALLYAALVSLYVAYSVTSGFGYTTDSFMIQYAMLRFGWLLMAGAGFALMVAVLDLFVGRSQHVMAALALGLTIAATYEVGLQVAYDFTHAYRQDKPLTQTERTTEPRGETQ